MSQEQESHLGNLAEEIRTISGIGNQTILEEFYNRNESEDPLSEDELEEKIDKIEENVDQLSFSTALERSMYYALLERLRLRVEMRGGVIDQENPMDRRDLEVLKDLERRITYEQHEQAAVDEMLDTVARYEAYRNKFNLDRPVSKGGIPRNAEIEKDVLNQLETLKELLPQMALVRRIRFYRYRLSLNSESGGLKDKITELSKQLPEGFKDENIDEYYGELGQQLRNILGYTSKGAEGRGIKTQRSIEMQTNAMQRHFESVLTRRKSLLGRTNPLAESEKQNLKEEHSMLLNEALEFNFRVVQQRTRLTTLLVLEGHMHQPVDEPQISEDPDRDYGLLKDRNALENERDRHIKMLEDYIHHFREDVLKEGESIDIPFIDEDVILDPSVIIEDIMTNYVIPTKLNLVEPMARGSTWAWSVHDTVWSTVGIDFDIKNRRTQAIMQPIFERLGLPPNYSELSDVEKAKARSSSLVQKKLRSVKTIIDTFRQNEAQALDNIEQDLMVLKKLLRKKKPSDLVLSGSVEVPEEFPSIDQLKTDEEIAGAYIFLMERLQTIRIQELDITQQKFINQLNENLNLNIDVADIEMQLSSAWIRETVYATSAILGEALAGYYMLRKSAAFALKKSPSALRSVVTNTARVGARAIRSSIEAVGQLRQSRTAEALTKTRYIEKERQLVQAVENTRFGRYIARMPALQNMRVVRVGGRVLRFAAWAAIPAVAAYESHITNQRVEETDNENLKEEYRKMHGSIWLEAAGIGSSFVLSCTPAIVLATPVIGAGLYNRKRREVVVDWKRNPQDWARDFDGAGLRQALEDASAMKAVEAGGGGTLKPRITSSWLGFGKSSKESQREAVDQMESAYVGTRGNIYEAYFAQNLFAPEGTDKKTKQEIVNNKTKYLRLITSGDFIDVPNETLQKADIYAELVERKQELESRGEIPLMSYLDEEGERHWMDLRSLVPLTDQNKDAIGQLIQEYRSNVKPFEEILLFYTQAEAAKESRAESMRKKNLGKVAEQVRAHLMVQLIHHLHDAEKYISVHNWPGFEMTGGEGSSENIVLAYVVETLRPKIEALVSELLAGELVPEQYEQRLREIENMLVDLREIDDTKSYLKKAADSVNAEKVEHMESHPLFSLFLPKES
ncbi:hypothetical protein KKF55_02290 [Patescibacteria group bacterium]|nr:hypothetical protein [Patescibacteria group bacterium]